MNTIYLVWMMLVQLSIFILIPFAIIGFLVWRTRRRRAFSSGAVAPADTTSRLAETIAIAGLSIAMMVMLAMYRVYDGTPYALTDMAPENAAGDYWKLIGLWSFAIAIGVGLAWFRKPISAVVLLTIFFCSAGYYVNEGLAFSYKAHEAEVRTKKLSLTVTLMNGLTGADVWFNGEYLGKTPIVADLDEVMTRIPNWNDREKIPEEFRDHRSFLKTKNGSFRPLSWFHLSPATRVTLDDEREDDRAIYARVELNGELMFASGWSRAQSGSRILGQIRDANVELDAFLPRWLDQREMLIHRARLDNYDVTPVWISAMESFGDEGWDQINQIVDGEPDFLRVLDQWARRRYSLPESMDQSTAMRVFEQIKSEADQYVSYHTHSIAGRAVDLLIPHLNHQDIVKSVIKRIESFRYPPSFGWQHRTIGGQFHFGTAGAENWKGPAFPSDLVLAHAIWRFDQVLDQQDDSQDNIIERMVTPALMRLSQNRTGTFHAAGALGGSLFENYVLRHDCRADVTDETDYNDKELYIGVNRWMYTAAQFRSPAGKRFRRDNVDRLLKMAERIVREGNSFDLNWGSNELDFLFLDPALEKRSLGYRFYRRFDEIATAGRHRESEAPNVRWEYLRRLAPNAPVDLFVEAYVPYCDHRCNKTPLTHLEPEFQFDVLTALIEKSDQLIAQVKKHSNPHGIRSANQEEFVSMRQQIDCQRSVDALMQWIDSHEKPSETIYLLRHRIESDRFPLSHLRALANSSDPSVQELVLRSIEQKPTPLRRALLERLLDSNNESVREKSVELQAKLQRWSQEPLSPRFIPPLKDDSGDTENQVKERRPSPTDAAG